MTDTKDLPTQLRDFADLLDREKPTLDDLSQMISLSGVVLEGIVIFRRAVANAINAINHRNKTNG